MSSDTGNGDEPQVERRPNEWRVKWSKAKGAHYYYKIGSSKGQWDEPKMDDLYVLGNTQGKLDMTPSSDARDMVKEGMMNKPSPLARSTSHLLVDEQICETTKGEQCCQSSMHTSSPNSTYSRPHMEDKVQEDVNAESLEPPSSTTPTMATCGKRHLQDKQQLSKIKSSTPKRLKSGISEALRQDHAGVAKNKLERHHSSLVPPPAPTSESAELACTRSDGLRLPSSESLAITSPQQALKPGNRDHGSARLTTSNQPHYPFVGLFKLIFVRPCRKKGFNHAIGTVMEVVDFEHQGTGWNLKMPLCGSKCTLLPVKTFVLYCHVYQGSNMASNQQAATDFMNGLDDLLRHLQARSRILRKTSGLAELNRHSILDPLKQRIEMLTTGKQYCPTPHVPTLQRLRLSKRCAMPKNTAPTNPQPVPEDEIPMSVSVSISTTDPPRGELTKQPTCSATTSKEPPVPPAAGLQNASSHLPKINAPRNVGFAPPPVSPPTPPPLVPPVSAQSPPSPPSQPPSLPPSPPLAAHRDQVDVCSNLISSAGSTSRKQPVETARRNNAGLFRIIFTRADDRLGCDEHSIMDVVDVSAHESGVGWVLYIPAGKMLHLHVERSNRHWDVYVGLKKACNQEVAEQYMQGVYKSENMLRYKQTKLRVFETMAQYAGLSACAISHVLASVHVTDVTNQIAAISADPPPSAATELLGPSITDKQENVPVLLDVIHSSSDQTEQGSISEQASNAKSTLLDHNLASLDFVSQDGGGQANGTEIDSRQAVGALPDEPVLDIDATTIESTPPEVRDPGTRGRQNQVLNSELPDSDSDDSKACTQAVGALPEELLLDIKPTPIESTPPEGRDASTRGRHNRVLNLELPDSDSDNEMQFTQAVGALPDEQLLDIKPTTSESAPPEGCDPGTRGRHNQVLDLEMPDSDSDDNQACTQAVGQLPDELHIDATMKKSTPPEGRDADARGRWIPVLDLQLPDSDDDDDETVFVYVESRNKCKLPQLN